MLPKKSKLNLSEVKNSSILKHAGKTTKHFKTFYEPQPANHFKGAVVVPLRLVKSAVVRNKLKRWGYSILQKHPITKSSIKLVVMYIKKPKLDFRQLELELSLALSELVTALEGRG